MSYCRFSDGDVYLYEGRAGIVCCACNLAPQVELDILTFDTRAEALAHLEEHRSDGQNVPEFVFDELREEIAAGKP